MNIENHISIFQELSQQQEEEKLDGSFLSNFSHSFYEQVQHQHISIFGENTTPQTVCEYYP